MYLYRMLGLTGSQCIRPLAGDPSARLEVQDGHNKLDTIKIKDGFFFLQDEIFFIIKLF